MIKTERYTPTTREILACAGIESLSCFTTDILKLECMPFHERMIEHQNANKYSLVLLPRGFGKTKIGTIARSVQESVINPDIRILVCSHTAEYSYDISSETKGWLDSEAVTALYGVQQGVPWTDKRFNVRARHLQAKEKTLTYVGAGQATIGWHGEIIILDDPVTQEGAQSAHQRERLRDWFNQVIWPCRQPDTRFMALGTRYHPTDLYQMFIESKRWAVLIMGALLVDGQRVTGDYGVTDLNELNELNRLRSLWPKQVVNGVELGYSVEELIAEREDLGPIPFALSRLNDVELAKGQIFSDSWFKWYDTIQGHVIAVAGGVDPGIGEKEQNDFFANYGVALTADGRFYILPDMILSRPDWESKVRLCADLHVRRRRMFPNASHETIVETVQAQKFLAEALRLKFRADDAYGDYSGEVRDCMPQAGEGKVPRAWNISGLFEQGRVYFPLGSPLAEKLASTLTHFPKVDHDDDFDALEMAVSALRKYVGTVEPDPAPGQYAGSVTGWDFQEMCENPDFWVKNG